jgi:hypothetical protein
MDNLYTISDDVRPFFLVAMNFVRKRYQLANERLRQINASLAMEMPFN